MQTLWRSTLPWLTLVLALATTQAPAQEVALAYSGLMLNADLETVAPTRQRGRWS